MVQIEVDNGDRRNDSSTSLDPPNGTLVRLSSIPSLSFFPNYVIDPLNDIFRLFLRKND